MMTKQLVGALGIVLGFVAFEACSASDSANGGTTTGQGGAGGQVGVCTPGQQVSCACPGGTTGVQICLPTGQGFGTCDCSGAGASGGYDPCGDAFCDSDENCRFCQEDCGICEPCDIAPSCDNAQIAPAELAHATDLDMPAMELMPQDEIAQWLAEQVAQASPAMRVVAAALDPTPRAPEPAFVAHVRNAFQNNPAAAARVRHALEQAGLDSPAAYRERFPVELGDLPQPVDDGSEQTFTPMADEFPGGTIECGSPFLRVGVYRFVVHDDQDGWAQGSNDEVYCLIEGESEGGYEIRVTPLVTIESGDEHLYSNEAGVFWGTEGPKTPGDDLLLTYNCIESDDSAAYQALIESIGDGAGQVGDVYEGSYGWVFPTIDGVSGVVSSAMAANGDDKVFNAQQQIPLDRQLALTNGEYWSIRRDGFDGDWEIFVRAWGCAEFGQLD
jgi:hypothetical protein